MVLAAHIFGNELNLIDHLAPFASLFQIPLVLTDQEIYRIAKKFYPDLEIILHEDYVTLENFLRKNFQGLVSCCYIKNPYENFLFSVYQKKLLHIWLPHGNSDKGMKENLFLLLKNEPAVFAYGDKMLDAFQMHGALKTIKYPLLIGNFRAFYFQKHLAFYRKKTNQLIKFKDPRKKTLFYAPSWGDETRIEKILQTLKVLIEEISPHLNLIIKPHPYSLNRISYEFERFEKNENVIFIKNFHAIYPLLEKADFYLGDFSSVGYDFLFFNRPLFFLNYIEPKQEAENKFLFQCGAKINHEKEIAEKILKGIEKDAYQKQRKKIYKYTFASTPNLKLLKNQLEKITKLENRKK